MMFARTSEISEDGTTCRLTVLAAADALDKVGNKAARGQIAAAKVCRKEA